MGTPQQNRIILRVSNLRDGKPFTFGMVRYYGGDMPANWKEVLNELIEAGAVIETPVGNYVVTDSTHPIFDLPRVQKG